MRSNSLSDFCLKATGALLAAMLALFLATRGAGADDGKQELDPKALIEELASPEFEVRRLAQEQLQGLGLKAFDALLEAQFHADVEVAHRARFILRSMAIEWVKESDPKDVKLILRGYGKSEAIERRSQIEALARLEDLRGVPALCRLSNYEFDPILSKFAALQIMQLDLSDLPHGTERVIKAIEAHVRPSRRTASKWLAEYAHWLAEPDASLAVWKTIVELERKELADASPNSSREMASTLYVWYADALRGRKRTEDAVAALRQTIEFLDPDERQVRDAVIGMLARDAHTIVDELAARYASLFAANPYLCYLHAESLQTRPRTAEEPTPREKIDALVARAIELAGSRSQVHKELAEFLEMRGQFDWFEKESRLVIGYDEVNGEFSYATRIDLGELLGELGRFDEAAEVLRPVAEKFEKEGPEPEYDFARMFIARFHFFQARSAEQKQNFEEQRSQLKQAVEAHLEDSDVIIDMYRAKNVDANWKEFTRGKIHEASEHFEKELKRLEAELVESQGNEPLRRDTNERIANTCNQYAWLIANTEGDMDKALERSRQSLELEPNYRTFQDTLARCYYAKGDYASAVKYQRMAVKQEPHSPAMKRQLALFEEAAEKAGKKIGDGAKK